MFTSFGRTSFVNKKRLVFVIDIYYHIPDIISLDMILIFYRSHLNIDYIINAID